MIYLLETNLPDTKSVFIALQKIYGINKYCSSYICKKLGVSFNFKLKNLTVNQKLNLIKMLETSNFFFTSKLKKFNNKNNQKLINIKSYRGLRKLNGYPARGQRTRSNAKTAKKLKS